MPINFYQQFMRAKLIMKQASWSKETLSLISCSFIIFVLNANYLLQYKMFIFSFMKNLILITTFSAFSKIDAFAQLTESRYEAQCEHTRFQAWWAGNLIVLSREQSIGQLIFLVENELPRSKAPPCIKLETNAQWLTFSVRRNQFWRTERSWPITLHRREETLGSHG